MRSEGPAVMKVRLQYAKTGVTRFLSHLDLLKCVERSLRRAQLPLAYSTGFHPHAGLHFGPALALGQASHSEWMDVDLAEAVAPTAVGERLNATLPDGLCVREAREIPMSTRSLQATIGRAVYRITVCGEGTNRLPDRVGALLSEQEIPVTKKNKVVNARSFVDALNATACSEQSCTLELALRLGPEGAVRPEDILAHLLDSDTLRIGTIERTALQEFRDGDWVSPWPLAI